MGADLANCRASSTVGDLGRAEKAQYATLFVAAAASGLRISELLALCSDDIDFEANTIRVDESVDRLGQIGPCKNVAAYRTVVLADTEGRHAMQRLRQFLKQEGLIFRSKRGMPLVENTILVQGLHPALKKLGLTKSACMRSVAAATVDGNWHEYPQQ